MSEKKNPAVEGLLRELGRGGVDNDMEFVSQVMEAVQERPARWKVWFPAGAGIAAIVAVILTVIVFQSSPVESSPSIATVRSVSGVVTVYRSDKSMILQIGDPLYRGDEILVERGSQAIFDYADATAVEVRDTARFTLEEQENGGKFLDITRGSLICSVAPQPSDQRLGFKTSHVQGKVIGTTLHINATESRTRVHTLTGEVAMQALEAKTWVPLPAGQVVTSIGKGLSVPVELGTEGFLSGDISWIQEFEEEYREEYDIEGTVEMSSRNSIRVSRIRSRPLGPDHGDKDWNPDHWISIERVDRQALFVLPEDAEIRVRVRSDREGYFALALAPVDPQIKNENVIVPKIEVGPEWRDILLTVKDFEIYRNSRKLEAGYPFRAFGFWGFEAGNLYVDRIIVSRR